MIRQTIDLYGAALDWAVGAALNKQYGEHRLLKVCRQEATTPPWVERENAVGSAPYFHRFAPSTEWAMAGPLIESERICLVDTGDEGDGMWRAYDQHDDFNYFGATPMIAAMRCYVGSQMGRNVELPPALY